MPTVGKITGETLRILIGGEVVECESGFSLTVDGDEIDTSCKGDGNWGDTLLGNKRWSLSINAVFVADATTAGFYELLENLIDGTTLAIEITTYDGTAAVTGDRFLSGNAVVMSTTFNGNMGEAATWDATLNGRGPLVTSTRA